MKKIVAFFSPILACDLGYFVTMALLALKCQYGENFKVTLGWCLVPAILQFSFVIFALYMIREKRNERHETN